MIAEEINKTEKQPFVSKKFDDNEMEEIRLAAWMHDVGKITTPEYVVDKCTKLQTIFDRINIVETRFALITKLIENKYLNKKLDLLQKGADIKEIESLDSGLVTELGNLGSDFELIKSSNLPGEFLSDDKISKLKEIAAKTYTLSDGEHPYITDEELENLLVRKGSLTEKERKIIENHAAVTHKMLSQLPFPRKLLKVPDYASEHHEKLDGSGYPRRLSAKNLPLQSRIIAIADIFEALTAKDRPYKKPMHISQVLKIMEMMKKDNHIDSDIYDLFVDSRLYEKYLEKEGQKDGN